MPNVHKIRWNPNIEEWYCAVCGRTSDHRKEEDAIRELEGFECSLPTPLPLAADFKREIKIIAEDTRLERVNAALKSSGKEVRKNHFVAGVIPPRVNYTMIQNGSPIDEDDDLTILVLRHGIRL
jgi:hypothetical protein